MFVEIWKKNIKYVF